MDKGEPAARKGERRPRREPIRERHLQRRDEPEERPDDQPHHRSAEEREEAIEGLEWFTKQGGKFDASRIPRTKPAFHNFFTDPDGYLWVMPTTTAAEKGHRFDIFDPDGHYLGPIVADFSSSSYSPLIIGDSFYTVTRDELEIPYLVRARIVGREVRASDMRAD